LDGNKLKLWELNENVDAVFKLQEADMTWNMTYCQVCEGSNIRRR
jgi:hypothetical protein